MIANVDANEAALCLASGDTQPKAAGGVWTPGAAMGLQLQRRLQDRAGLSFSIIEPEGHAPQ